MSKYDEIHVGLDTPDLHEHIQIALANIPVLESRIEASYLDQAGRKESR